MLGGVTATGGSYEKPLFLDRVYYLSYPHRIDFGLVTNFNIRLRL